MCGQCEMQMVAGFSDCGRGRTFVFLFYHSIVCFCCAAGVCILARPKSRYFYVYGNHVAPGRLPHGFCESIKIPRFDERVPNLEENLIIFDIVLYLDRFLLFIIIIFPK